MCFRSPFSVYKCGRCPECLKDKRLEWSIRLQMTAKYRGEKVFLAHLTYNNKNVPINDKGKLTLSKTDVRNFIKRLRYYLNEYYKENEIENKKDFKYFCAGEYGPNNTHRPHYHILLFGFPQVLEKEKAIALLQNAWRLGFVRHTSDWVESYAQVHYPTKYMINYFDENYSEKEPPFCVCSNGFGKEFINDAKKSNRYPIEIQQLFICNKAERKVKNSRSNSGYNFIKVPTSWVFEIPAFFESMTKVWLNPILENFPDWIEYSTIQNGRETIYRVPLPRYFAKHLYTEDFRMALAQFKDFKSRKHYYDYVKLYGSYDGNSSVPMWLQIKRNKWNRAKKTKKDKLLKVDINKILND